MAVIVPERSEGLKLDFYSGQGRRQSEPEIIAHGPDFAQVRAAAEAAGHPDAILENVRRPDRLHIG